MEQSWWNMWLIISVLLLVDLCQINDASAFRKANRLKRQSSHPKPILDVSSYSIENITINEVSNMEETSEMFRRKRAIDVKEAQPPAHKGIRLGSRPNITRNQAYVNENSDQLDWKINVEVSKRDPTSKLKTRIKSSRRLLAKNFPRVSETEGMSNDMNITEIEDNDFLGFAVQVEGRGGNSSYDDLWDAWNSIGGFLLELFGDGDIGLNDTNLHDYDDERVLLPELNESSFPSDEIQQNLNESNSQENFYLENGLGSQLNGSNSYGNSMQMTEKKLLSHGPNMSLNEQTDTENEGSLALRRNQSWTQSLKSSSDWDEAVKSLNQSKLEPRFIFNFFDRGSGNMERDQIDTTTDSQRREGRFILGFLGFGVTPEPPADDIGSGEDVFDNMLNTDTLEYDNQWNTLEEVKNLNITRPRPRFLDRFFDIGSGQRSFDSPPENDTESEKQQRFFWNVFGSGSRELSLDKETTDTFSESTNVPFYEELSEEPSVVSSTTDNSLNFQTAAYYPIYQEPLFQSESEATSEPPKARFFAQWFNFGSGDGRSSRNNLENETETSDDGYEDTSLVVDVIYKDDFNLSQDDNGTTNLESFAIDSGSAEGPLVTISENVTTDFVPVRERGARLLDDQYGCSDYDCYFEENITNSYEPADTETEAPTTNEVKSINSGTQHNELFDDLHSKFTEISKFDITYDSTLQTEHLVTTATFNKDTNIRKPKLMDDFNFTLNTDLHTTSDLAMNSIFPTHTMSTNILSSETEETLILSEMPFPVTKHPRLSKSCTESWECDSILNERCITSHSPSMCDCGRSFVRHPISGRCEVRAVVVASLRFPNETFHEDLKTPSSEVFKETKNRAIDTMNLLLEGNPELFATVVEFDVIGFKPGSLIISWSLVISAEDDTMESIMQKVDEGLKESLQNPAVLSKMPFKFYNMSLLEVHPSSINPCQSSSLNYCSKNAVCITMNSTATGFKCKCQDGYMDLSENKEYPGEVCKAQCFPGYCGEHGECHVTDEGNMKCECKGFFVGDKCATSGVVLVAGTSTAIVLCLIAFIAIFIYKYRRHAMYGGICGGSQRSQRTDEFGLPEADPERVTDVLALKERKVLPGRFAYLENTPRSYTLSPNVPKITVTSPSLTATETSCEFSDSTFDSMKS